MSAGNAPKPTGNLGAEADGFFGRDAELTAVDAILDRGARLVTLHGPGGVGKTRLARRLASRRGERLRGGVWACDLAGARDARDVELTVALALGLSIRRSRDVAGEIGRALSELGPTLVLLDDCDQAVAAVASALTRWMASAPEVVWLATSRELLHAPGENAFEVGPLPVESSASELFVDRVRAARAGWQPDDPSLVVDIVRRLEGMPLAVELAAARMRVLDLRTLSDRLAKSFDILGARAHGRHSSLRGAVSWSWDLLEDWEKRALAQCAVFRGGFDLTAAEAVLDVGRPSIDAVHELRDKSLVHAYTPDGFPGEVRFGMYESIRAFAEESLRASGDEDSARERHARHYLDVGTLWEQETWHGAIDSLLQLGLERENLLAVYERALRAGQAEQGSADVLRALIALFPIFGSRGPIAAYLSLAEAAHDDELLAGAPPALRARYLLVRGRARQLGTRRLESLSDFQSALVAARAVNETRLIARSLVHLGTAERLDGRPNDARDRFEAALRLFEREEDARAIAVVLSAIGAIDLVSGALDTARPMLLRAIDTLASLGDEATRGMVMIDMGIVEQERGDESAARAAFDEALRIHRQTGNLRFVSIAAGYKAGLEYETGHAEDARRGYEEAISIAATFGDLKLLATFGAGLGGLLASLGDREAAQRALDEAERQAREQGEPRIVATVALHRARADVAWGDTASARDRRARAVGLMRQSDDVRFAMRMLERALGASGVSAQEAYPEEALVVGEDASFVRPPRGERFELGRRESLKRVLMTLAWRRVEAPGTPVTHAELVSAGWPGEKLDETVGLNRLNVALAELRKRGLRDVLRRAEGGHLLDPAVPLVMDRT